MKIFFRKVFVLCTSLMSLSAIAVEPVYSSGFFSKSAIKGYDTVAYFTQNKAVKGKSKYSVEFQGATWLFASQENLDLFKSDPEKFSPQYGGYCAYAVSQGETAPIKPELFTIHDGKLYLNYNKKINDKWSDSKESFIKEADENWPKLLNQ